MARARGEACDMAIEQVPHADGRPRAGLEIHVAGLSDRADILLPSHELSGLLVIGEVEAEGETVGVDVDAGRDVAVEVAGATPQVIQTGSGVPSEGGLDQREACDLAGAPPEGLPAVDRVRGIEVPEDTIGPITEAAGLWLGLVREATDALGLAR